MFGVNRHWWASFRTSRRRTAALHRGGRRHAGPSHVAPLAVPVHAVRRACAAPTTIPKSCSVLAPTAALHQGGRALRRPREPVLGVTSSCPNRRHGMRLDPERAAIRAAQRPGASSPGALCAAPLGLLSTACTTGADNSASPERAGTATSPALRLTWARCCLPCTTRQLWCGHGTSGWAACSTADNCTHTCWFAQQ